LAEKFALNLNWYVDVIVKLITTESAGDYVSDEIRYRVYQILTGFGDAEPNYELQKYAALQIFLAMQGDKVHETMIKLGASVLPEFGYHIADAPGKSSADQFDIIFSHFNTSNSSTKAMILSSLMKIGLQHEEQRERAIEVFKRHSTNWDEDIQQRSVEYLRMLKMVDNDPSKREFIEMAFETLPTFPDHMQNSSVLIKRMSNMKKQKGLITGTNDKKDDDDIPAEKGEEYKSGVSAALSKTKSTAASKGAAHSSDLLFSDSNDNDTGHAKDDNDVMDLLSFDMDETPSGSSGSISHAFAKQNPDDFASEQTVKVDEESEELSLDGPQDSKWKTLLPGNSTDGTIYEDDEIKVNIKFNISKYLTRVLLEYVSNTGSTLSEIQAQVKAPDGIKANVSPTKYPDGDNPKAMLMIMATAGIEKPIRMAIRYESGFGETKTVVFKVPVLINKFIDKVEMEQDRFDHLWNDISKNRPSSFEKLDMILKNPAGSSGVDHMAVLKKLAKLMSL